MLLLAHELLLLLIPGELLLLLEMMGRGFIGRELLLLRVLFRHVKLFILWQLFKEVLGTHSVGEIVKALAPPEFGCMGDEVLEARRRLDQMPCTALRDKWF